MALYDHYLKEDQEQLDANLILMHQSLINVIQSTANADFSTAESSWIQFQKSYKIVHALHKKKATRKENEINEYMRRHYF